jgi:hypothetical protein
MCKAEQRACFCRIFLLFLKQEVEFPHLQMKLETFSPSFTPKKTEKK